ncbi:MAG: hypothetical protein P4L79_02135 [Legionella sp.]|uniref:hypothetical protein n=1 Tax=Legionella sp. TaxID=459 RepID=UPI00284309A2|nr:hypothetical protein [Legionella sp.]
MSASKLFHMPIELLVEIYSKLSPREIIAKRAISKETRLAADLALFSQKNYWAIHYQTRLLMQWSDKPDAWFYSFFRGRTEAFYQNLFSSIKSDSSNAYHRLLGLRILGAIKNHSLSIDQDLANRLLEARVNEFPTISSTLDEQSFTEIVTEITETSLVHETPSTRLAAMKNLSNISIKMKPEQRDLLIIMANGALNDTNPQVREGAIIALSKISNQMTPKQFTVFINRAIKILDEGNSIVRYTALKQLSKLISKMSLEQLISFIGKTDVFTNTRNNEPLMIRLTVWERLLEITDLNNEQMIIFIEDVSNILQKNSHKYYMNALDSLSKMASKLTPKLLDKFIQKNKYFYQALTQGLSAIASGLHQPEQHAVFIAALGKMLSYKDIESRQAALDNLSKFASKMELKPHKKFIAAITKALSDPNPEIRQTALKNFPTIASTMNPEQLNTFITATINALNAPEPGVRQAGLHNYSIIASKGTPEQLSTFISGAIRALTGQDPTVHKTALLTLRALSTKMNADERTSFITEILAILNNPNSRLTANNVPIPLVFPVTTDEPLNESLGLYQIALLSLAEITRQIKNPEQYEKFQTILDNASKDQNPNISQVALLIWMAIYRKINPIERRLPFISQTLFKAVNHTSLQIAQTALQYLSELTSDMKSEQLTPFINHINEALKSQNIDDRKAALKSFPIIADKMNSNELTTSINLTIEILNGLAAERQLRNYSSEIYSLALKTLPKIASKLDSDQLNALITAISNNHQLISSLTLESLSVVASKIDANQFAMLITATTAAAKLDQSGDVFGALSKFVSKKEQITSTLFFTLAAELLENPLPRRCQNVLLCLETFIDEMESEQLKLFCTQLNEKLNDQDGNVRNCAFNIISRLIVCNQYEITDPNGQTNLSFEETVLRNLSQMHSQMKPVLYPNKKRPASTAAAEYEDAESSTKDLSHKRMNVDDSEENQNAMQL